MSSSTGRCGVTAKRDGAERGTAHSARSRASTAWRPAQSVRISSGPRRRRHRITAARQRRARRPRAPAPAVTRRPSPAAWIFPANGGRCSSRPSSIALVEQALKGNPDVAAAQAALRQAHELYLAQWTSFLPTVQGSFGATRSRYATASLTAPTTAPTADLQPLYGATEPQLHARRFRRDAAHGGGGAGPKRKLRAISSMRPISR